MPNWVNQASADYQQRLHHHWPTKLTEITPHKRRPKQSADESKQIEAAAIEKAINPRSLLVITAVDGKLISTETLSEKCLQWQQHYSSIDIIIGGPDGIADNLLARADFTWSLSPLTLPHPLVRVVIMEQLYRAWSIGAGHPYHRA